MRHIRLTFIDTGEQATAELLDEEAPETCKLVWNLLPLESSLVHGMYSGSEVFALLDDPKPAPPENLVQLPLPGELLYFYDEGREAAGKRKPVAELCLVYGRGVMLRGHEGVPVRANLFASIPGDWRRDWAAFAQACRSVRWEGPRRLRLEPCSSVTRT